MALIFVAATGSNTAPYDTWAKAATSLQTALSAAAAGDTVVVQYNGVPAADAELSANTTYTFAASASVISASADDADTAFTPTPMGASYWIGNSSVQRTITIAGGHAIYMYGVTLRSSGTSTGTITLAATDGQVFFGEECLIWLGTTHSSTRLQLGPISTNANVVTRLKNSVLRFGSVSQGVLIASGRFFWEGGAVSPDGAAPATLFSASTYDSSAGADLFGVDLSAVTGTLIGDMQGGTQRFRFAQCTRAPGVTVMATQTAANESGAHAELLDSSGVGAHYEYSYHNAMGALTLSGAIYAADHITGATPLSWKIETTAAASAASPFVSPWISKRNAVTTAITPALEILRDGSATAYTDAEVWGEWSVKATAASPLATLYSDRAPRGKAGSAQAAGMGLAGWTGESGAAWSGKLSPASAITPTAVGDIQARVCVAAPSAVVYVDPQIRGL